MELPAVIGNYYEGVIIMGSILRGVPARILAINDKSANYSVLMDWIFLKHGIKTG